MLKDDDYLTHCVQLTWARPLSFSFKNAQKHVGAVAKVKHVNKTAKIDAQNEVRN